MLSFLYAMVTVCASFDERLLARWAEGESGRADQLWGTIESETSFQRLAETYLSDVRIGEDGYWEVPMTDFIEICPKISGAYWRLPNRPVREGWVILFRFRREQPAASRTFIEERIRTRSSRIVASEWNSWMRPLSVAWLKRWESLAC